METSKAGIVFRENPPTSSDAVSIELSSIFSSGPGVTDAQLNELAEMLLEWSFVKNGTNNNPSVESIWKQGSEEVIITI